jgi:hypothetical protein
MSSSTDLIWGLVGFLREERMGNAKSYLWLNSFSGIDIIWHVKNSVWFLCEVELEEFKWLLL